MNKRTDELASGDRVALPGGIVRTVKRVEQNGYRNFRNQPLFDVAYAEGQTAEWSAANMTWAGELWTVEL